MEHTSPGVRVGIRTVCGCAGVWCVGGWFFSVDTCLLLTVSTTRGTVPLALVTAQHDRILPQTFSYLVDFLRIRHVPWSRSWHDQDPGVRLDTSGRRDVCLIAAADAAVV